MVKVKVVKAIKEEEKKRKEEVEVRCVKVGR
jgi:hypothetical protein